MFSDGWGFLRILLCLWISAQCVSGSKKELKKFWNFSRKIWKLIKKSYLCTPIWKTGGWWGWEFLERLAQKWWLKRNFEKSFKKVWKFENNAYLCSPVRKTGSRKREWEVHWKDWLLYKKQVPRKYNLSRSVNSFERIISVSDKLEIYKRLYNEEFDPGSGWTLAAGLTHASRGAAWGLAITLDGDRRKGA